jgi:DNA repair protein RecN (Recombination protein N)
MITHLYIENYTLIEKLNIDFAYGFSIITGETGAGKSILLGAMSLILGNRADTQVLLNNKKKCIVEGNFRINNYGLEDFFDENELDYNDETIIRREINQHGKSRAFINDSPVNLNVLKDLGNKLVDIHSQHKTLTLNDSNFQLAIVDNFASNQNILNDYKKEFVVYKELKSYHRQIVEKNEKSRTDKDYFRFLFDELDKAKLVADEQEEIENNVEILNNSEEIKINLNQSLQLLNNDDDNIITKLSLIKSLIEKIQTFHPDIQQISIQLNSSLLELQDIVGSLEKANQVIEHDPEKSAFLNERLSLIYNLQQKHKVKTINELNKIKNKLEQDLNDISSFDEKIKIYEEKILLQEKKLEQISQLMRKRRLEAITHIEDKIINLLSVLGMPHARVNIHHEQLEEYGTEGKDRIIFLFNANKGIDLKEISKVASGGELSRLMLSIKSLISQRNLLPTIIFDEIDMGVSGDIAGKVGNIMKTMALKMQVIAITHLPQIAGKAESHYLVYKQSDLSSTKSNIKKLNNDERVQEIAKMLSNEKISDAAVETAKELLNN